MAIMSHFFIPFFFILILCCCLLFLFNIIFSIRRDKIIDNMTKDTLQSDKDIKKVLNIVKRQGKVRQAFALRQLTRYDLSDEMLEFIYENFNNENYYCQKFLILLYCKDVDHLIKYLITCKINLTNYVLLEEINTKNYSKKDWDKLFEFYQITSIQHKQLLISLFKSNPDNYPFYVFLRNGEAEEKCAILKYYTWHRDYHIVGELKELLQLCPHWEVKYLALKVLGNYIESQEVVAEYLEDSNWYIRSAAAESMLKINPDYRTASRDRYAQEMLKYKREVLKNENLH